ncbi:MAG: hypothetical protein M1829_004472 [Trizodia sp. TS-e1964]|nr:MAG: hypothetical protein M1829_004472 [Trizodia sp. TS-e1964]
MIRLKNTKLELSSADIAMANNRPPNRRSPPPSVRLQLSERNLESVQRSFERQEPSLFHKITSSDLLGDSTEKSNEELCTDITHSAVEVVETQSGMAPKIVFTRRPRHDEGEYGAKMQDAASGPSQYFVDGAGDSFPGPRSEENSPLRGSHQTSPRQLSRAAESPSPTSGLFYYGGFTPVSGARSNKGKSSTKTPQEDLRVSKGESSRKDSSPKLPNIDDASSAQGEDKAESPPFTPETFKNRSRRAVQARSPLFASHVPSVDSSTRATTTTYTNYSLKYPGGQRRTTNPYINVDRARFEANELAQSAPLTNKSPFIDSEAARSQMKLQGNDPFQASYLSNNSQGTKHTSLALTTSRPRQLPPPFSATLRSPTPALPDASHPLFSEPVPPLPGTLTVDEESRFTPRRPKESPKDSPTPSISDMTKTLSLESASPEYADEEKRYQAYGSSRKPNPQLSIPAVEAAHSTSLVKYQAHPQTPASEDSSYDTKGGTVTTTPSNSKTEAVSHTPSKTLVKSTVQKSNLNPNNQESGASRRDSTAQMASMPLQRVLGSQGVEFPLSHSSIAERQFQIAENATFGPPLAQSERTNERPRASNFSRHPGRTYTHPSGSPEHHSVQAQQSSGLDNFDIQHARGTQQRRGRGSNSARSNRASAQFVQMAPVTPWTINTQQSSMNRTQLGYQTTHWNEAMMGNPGLPQRMASSSNSRGGFTASGSYGKNFIPNTRNDFANLNPTNDNVQGERFIVSNGNISREPSFNGPHRMRSNASIRGRFNNGGLQRMGSDLNLHIGTTYQSSHDRGLYPVSQSGYYHSTQRLGAVNNFHSGNTNDFLYPMESDRSLSGSYSTQSLPRMGSYNSLRGAISNDSFRGGHSTYNHRLHQTPSTIDMQSPHIPIGSSQSIQAGINNHNAGLQRIRSVNDMQGGNITYISNDRPQRMDSTPSLRSAFSNQSLLGGHSTYNPGLHRVPSTNNMQGESSAYIPNMSLRSAGSSQNLEEFFNAQNASHQRMRSINDVQNGSNTHGTNDRPRRMDSTPSIRGSSSNKNLRGGQITYNPRLHRTPSTLDIQGGSNAHSLNNNLKPTGSSASLRPMGSSQSLRGVYNTQNSGHQSNQSINNMQGGNGTYISDNRPQPMGSAPGLRGTGSNQHLRDAYNSYNPSLHRMPSNHDMQGGSIAHNPNDNLQGMGSSTSIRPMGSNQSLRGVYNTQNSGYQSNQSINNMQGGNGTYISDNRPQPMGSAPDLRGAGSNQHLRAAYNTTLHRMPSTHNMQIGSGAFINSTHNPGSDPNLTGGTPIDGHQHMRPNPHSQGGPNSQQRDLRGAHNSAPDTYPMSQSQAPSRVINIQGAIEALSHTGGPAESRPYDTSSRRDTRRAIYPPMPIPIIDGYFDDLGPNSATSPPTETPTRRPKSRTLTEKHNNRDSKQK